MSRSEELWKSQTELGSSVAIEELVKGAARIERGIRAIRWALGVAIVFCGAFILVIKANPWVTAGVLWMVAIFGSLLVWVAFHRRPSPAETGIRFVRSAIEIRMRWALLLRWTIVAEVAGLLAILRGTRAPRPDDLVWIAVMLIGAWAGPRIIRNRARRDLAMLGF